MDCAFSRWQMKLTFPARLVPDNDIGYFLLWLSSIVVVVMADLKSPLWKRVKTEGEHIPKEENIC